MLMKQPYLVSVREPRREGLLNLDAELISSLTCPPDRSLQTEGRRHSGHHRGRDQPIYQAQMPRKVATEQALGVAVQPAPPPPGATGPRTDSGTTRATIGSAGCRRFSARRKYQKSDPRQSLKQLGEAQVEMELNPDIVPVFLRQSRKYLTFHLKMVEFQ